MTSYSPVSRATGVTSASVIGDACITTPPSMISPETISASPRPRSAPMNRANPIVPAAPVTFSTATVRTSPSACSACCSARAVWSQPPPGAAGAVIRSSGQGCWPKAGAATTSDVETMADATAARSRPRAAP